VFPEPETKLTTFARLPGLDGKKMGKSNDNYILMSDPEEKIYQKVRTAITDPQKVRRNDPGHPDICNVYWFHKKFNPEEVQQIRKDCESGVLGCVDCKKNCSIKIAQYFAPTRDKRAYYETNLNEVDDIIDAGIKRAREEAAATMTDVYNVMKMG